MPTPVLAWSACHEIAECATVRLPLDHDRPRGATTEVAVLRVKARDRANRIGSLFVNPGGPAFRAPRSPRLMSDVPHFGSAPGWNDSTCAGDA
ncbi:hypothetical protein [Catenuloplanes atrovinosus]|uniref:Uncharacterized protein n=1 Tax=Catenuloplanes atrovinosus TaxID=137266 RepID=A0AAE3YLE9_9ACTN|nr:hypothetical protein [Catenuloplanes atrovinosus]MDR7275660.1 hypothetical protein [Catenuloplanes atrovinosus]